MYLINLFKKHISHSVETLEIYDINGQFNRVFQVLNIDCGKNKKVCKYHNYKAIILNYKHDKLHHGSKYINIIFTFNSNWTMLFVDNSNYIIQYIYYKNDNIIFGYNNGSLRFPKYILEEEYYFYNKCIIKVIKDINGVREYYDYEYKKTDGYNFYPKEKVNVVWSTLKKIFDNRISRDVQYLFSSVGIVSLYILEIYLLTKCAKKIDVSLVLDNVRNLFKK